MRKLSLFLKFDSEQFFGNMSLKVMSSEVWTDFGTKETLGSRYTVIVWEDNNDYGEDTNVSNHGQSLTVKVPNKMPKPIDAPVDCDIISPVCKVYGDYNTELSITADDVVFLAE